MNRWAINKSTKIISLSIIAGIILYLSKFLRGYFTGDHSILFILGFLPNLGLAFAIPFVYVSNRVRQRKPVKHFNISCAITFLLMVLNEVRDKYQSGRVFDMFDIYASFAGVLFAYLVFQLTLNKYLTTNQ